MKGIVLQLAFAMCAFQDVVRAQIHVEEPVSPIIAEYTSTLCSDGLVEIIANAESGASVQISIQNDYDDGGFSVLYDILYCSDSNIVYNSRTTYTVEIQFSTPYASDGTPLQNFTVIFSNLQDTTTPVPPPPPPPTTTTTITILNTTTATTTIPKTKTTTTTIPETTNNTTSPSPKTSTATTTSKTPPTTTPTTKTTTKATTTPPKTLTTTAAATTATKTTQKTRTTASSTTITLQQPLRFTFPTNNALFAIPEDTGANEVIANLTATMTDCTFSVNGSELFIVNGNILQTASTVTNKTFDVDGKGTVTNYTLVLKATKGKSFDELTVTITINDVNDHPPMFSELNYSFSINKTSEGGDVVGIVAAIDADRINNIVSYQLTGTHVFIIDNSTGVIRLAYEVLVDQAIYIFQAIATDSNEEVQLSSETTVTVNKQTVNKQTERQANSAPTAAIVGAVLGSAVIVLIIALLVLAVHRRFTAGKHIFSKGHSEQRSATCTFADVRPCEHALTSPVTQGSKETKLSGPSSSDTAYNGLTMYDDAQHIYDELGPR